MPRRLKRGDLAGAWLLDRTNHRPHARWARDRDGRARRCRRWWTQDRGRPRADHRGGEAGVRKIRMNRRRCFAGAVLICLLLAIVIALAFAHAWAPTTTIAGQGARCFDDFAHSKWPMWLGCAIAAHETLAGGLIAAAGALFGAWLAYRLLKEQIALLKEQIAIDQQNTRILQRACISVEPLGIEPLYSSDQVPDNVLGHVQFRNVGHLPAQNLQLSPIKLKWIADDLIEAE